MWPDDGIKPRVCGWDDEIMRDTATRQGRDLVAGGYLVLLQEPHADAVSSLHTGKLGCTQGRPSRQKT